MKYPLFNAILFALAAFIGGYYLGIQVTTNRVTKQNALYNSYKP